MILAAAYLNSMPICARNQFCWRVIIDSAIRVNFFFLCMTRHHIPCRPQQFFRSIRFPAFILDEGLRAFSVLFRLLRISFSWMYKNAGRYGSLFVLEGIQAKASLGLKWGSEKGKSRILAGVVGSTLSPGKDDCGLETHLRFRDLFVSQHSCDQKMFFKKASILRCSGRKRKTNQMLEVLRSGQWKKNCVTDQIKLKVNIGMEKHQLWKW